MKILLRLNFYMQHYYISILNTGIVIEFSPDPNLDHFHFHRSILTREQLLELKQLIDKELEYGEKDS